MAETTSAPNNKPVAFKGAVTREPSGAAKKAVVRKKAKSAMKRGMISEKAAARHLKSY
jgi:hypothetical protein